MKFKKKDRYPAGFNRARYRRMAIIFSILSILNIATVLLGFSRSGYGLYYAEDALSHVAKINQSVQTVNESALTIVINSTNPERAKSELEIIRAAFHDVHVESDAYKKLDLDQIDPDLKAQFTDAADKVETYRLALFNYYDELSALIINSNSGSTGEAASAQISEAELAKFIQSVGTVYSNDIEPLKEEAETAVTNLFDKQNEATYNFFVRAAQQFLFILLFLVITWIVGIIGINTMKKRAARDAQTIATEQKKAKESREKSESIAYSNILTGFRNRYGMEADIGDQLASKKFVIAMYDFNEFNHISEKYGRDTGDEFLSVISGKLQQRFAKLADIYSTDSAEFCFIFKKSVSPAKADEAVYMIADAMSKPVAVTNHAIKNTVSACFCHYNPGDQPDFNSLFLNLDKGMKVAKDKSKQAGQTSVVNIDTI